MKVVAAFLLALLGGNATPSDKDLKNILASVGADADDDKIELLLSQVKGKDITELIASGRERLASVPSGGGVAVAAVAAAGGGGGDAAPAAAAEEPKKEDEESAEETYLICRDCLAYLMTKRSTLQSLVLKRARLWDAFTMTLKLWDFGCVFLVEI
ncbi:putative ribosomal protein P2 [Helianthus annuus]|nr:putative ribosomal protein P2 [Helianthus annuus]